MAVICFQRYFSYCFKFASRLVDVGQTVLAMVHNCCSRFAVWKLNRKESLKMKLINHKYEGYNGVKCLKVSPDTEKPTVFYFQSTTDRNVPFGY